MIGFHRVGDGDGIGVLTWVGDLRLVDVLYPVGGLVCQKFSDGAGITDGTVGSFNFRVVGVPSHFLFDDQPS